MIFKEGSKALVCGSSGGIGASVAKKLAEQGVAVTLVARTEEKLSQLVKNLPGEKGKHSFYAADLGLAQDVDGLVDFLNKNKAYSIFINNAGGPKGGPLLLAENKEFKHAFSVHILAAQAILKELVPQMESFGSGRIVNIISTSVKVPIPNLGVSNTIRGAVASWAKTQSLELGPKNITVNNVLPGYTKTQRLESLVQATAEKMGLGISEVEALWKSKVPLGRFAEPEEVAEAVCFLASENGSYINGVSLPVDGGRTGAF